jgi:hypothetical protein
MSQDRELGRRWVEALGDKAWAPGMLCAWDDSPPRRLNDAEVKYDRCRFGCVDGWYERRPSNGAPDLNDGATLGAMLAIVCRLVDPIAHLVPTWSTPAGDLTWCVLSRDGRLLGCGPTGGAALVAAAEAWRRELTATTTNRGDHRE